uniref:Glucose-6-phosphate isomerase n=1 Tax=Heterorhabditis bacteriophora TaxID=37862 RepID=A0A1I7X8U8_HETBA
MLVVNGRKLLQIEYLTVSFLQWSSGELNKQLAAKHFGYKDVFETNRKAMNYDGSLRD